VNSAQGVRLLILRLLKEKGDSANKMLIELGFNQSLLTDMSRKNSMPSADKLGFIAQYLDVSIDYLLGRTDNPNVNR